MWSYSSYFVSSSKFFPLSFVFFFFFFWVRLAQSNLLPFLSFFLARCLSRSPVLSVCLSEWREHQRDQAGLVYWKQMADQRQEGHSFMKRGLNMPGPCRGACPWMMATWSVYVCERFGGDSLFCRLPIWGIGPLIPNVPSNVPACFFF